jgi:type IV pilus assembly protein PilV
MVRHRLVLKNKKGYTLVEVMIALLIFLLVTLAMMQTAMVSIDSNMVNVLRDEAVKIAEMRMNDARNLAFTQTLDSLPVGTDTVPVTRNFRDMTITYNTERKVTALGTSNKQVDISVTWTWKGTPYTHTVSSIMRRQ